MSDSVGGVAEQEPDPRIRAIVEHGVGAWPLLRTWEAADLLAAADAVDPKRMRRPLPAEFKVEFEDDEPIDEIRAVRADLLTTRTQLAEALDLLDGAKSGRTDPHHRMRWGQRRKELRAAAMEGKTK